MFRTFARFKAQSSSTSPFALTVTILGFLVPGILLPSTAQAGQLGGQSYFDHSPRLIRSAASIKAVRTSSSYEFTIAVPQDAGAALQTVKVVQERNLDRVQFQIANSSAFLGDSLAGGRAAPLAAVGGEMPKDTNEATLTFNPPIQPGQTVTVVLDAQANPWNGGIYLFGITAYPEGNQTSGLFLGFGRIQIQDY
jgi:hypothetical protein